MRAEKMLQQLIEVNAYIDTLLEEQEEALTRATHITPRLKEDVIQTARENGMEKKMIAYAEYHYLIDSEIDRYVELKKRAMEYIKRLPNRKHQVILIKFYFRNVTTREIANFLCHDERQIQRLKTEAIEEIDRMMANMS